MPQHTPAEKKKNKRSRSLLSDLKNLIPGQLGRTLLTGANKKIKKAIKK